MRYALPIPVLAIAFLLSGQSLAADIDWAKVDAALGKTASVQGEVHRYGIPRSDLQVTVDGVTIKPALALGGWLGFEPMAGGALVMGDLVLTEPEIEPVMTKAACERHRSHRPSQPPPARQPCHLLHARSWAWRSCRTSNCRPRRAWREQDAIWSSCRACVSGRTDRPRHGSPG